ncbi:MAG: endonuclease NucS domain-containing protein [Candidatus Nanoarchaeia archaeon]
MSSLQLNQSLKSLLKKKLEETVLRSLDFLEKGDVDSKIVQYREIARQNGFEDILGLLDTIASEVGWSQIENNLTPRKNLTLETKLGDFLCSELNLNLIEDGLKYLKRELVIDSGRLDLYCLDPKEKPVVIELKITGNYLSKDVYYQLKKYLSDESLKEARLIFVAPKIKADLFNTISKEFGTERVSWVRVNQDEEGYHFIKVNKYNLDKTKKHDWNKKQVDPQLERVHVVDRKKQKKIQIKTKEELAPIQIQEPAKLIPQEDFDSYPLYYQLMLKISPELKNKERYLGPIIVTDNQYYFLNKFISTPTLTSYLQKFEECLGPNTVHLTLEEVLSKLPNSQEVLNKLKLKLKNKQKRIISSHQCRDLFVDYMLNIEDIIFDFFESFKDKSAVKNEEDFNSFFEIFSQSFVNISEELESLRKIDKLKKFCTYEIDIYKNLHSIIGNKESKDALIVSEFLYSHTPEKLLKEWVFLKINRVEKLLEIDKEIAFTYLSFNPNLDMRQKILSSDLLEDIQLSRKEIFKELYNFIKKDNALYESIMSKLKVQDSDYFKGGGVITKGSFDSVKNIPVVEMSPTKDLFNYLTKKCNGGLNDNTKKRLEHFAQETCLLLDKTKTNELRESFDKSHICKNMKRKEYQLENEWFYSFFDDVQFEFINKGVIPTNKQLDILYEGVLKEQTTKNYHKKIEKAN